jgi:hypothetical protein
VAGERNDTHSRVCGRSNEINDKEWIDDWSNECDAKAMIRKLKEFVKKLEELEGY